jgi:hypothetical protein
VIVEGFVSQHEYPGSRAHQPILRCTFSELDGP